MTEEQRNIDRLLQLTRYANCGGRFADAIPLVAEAAHLLGIEALAAGHSTGTDHPETAAAGNASPSDATGAAAQGVER